MQIKPKNVSTEFDGAWELSTTSNSSNCGGGTNTVQVQNGKMSGQVTGKNGIYAVNGWIDANGAVNFQLDTGVATFKGQAKENTATGRWNGGQCRGSFAMVRS